MANPLQMQIKKKKNQQKWRKEYTKIQNACATKSCYASPIHA